jgi:Zn-dependent peptidase ImmA (M78 family)/transcriptional regulator with XRE-family HTH domain
MSTEILGANIRLARLFNGLSLAELGERLDKSKQYLSRVETGAEPISLSLEQSLLEQLGILPEFLRRVDPMPLTDEQCHFRKQLTTKAVLRQYGRARGEMLKRLVCVLDEHLELPDYNITEADPSSDEAIERGAEACRIAWGLGWGPIANITRVAETAGAVVMRVSGLAHEVDAVSFATRRPVIALNDTGRSACRARFGVAHELGHFALHTGVLTGDRLTEAQANRFASAFLLPRATFLTESKRALRGTRINWDTMSGLKLRWGVSKAALLYRSRQLGVCSQDQVRAGYITLNRHGEAVEEREDNAMAIEQPEIVNDGLRVMTEQLGVPMVAVARRMGVQLRLLHDLLGTGPQAGGATVVNFLGAA